MPRRRIRRISSPVIVEPQSRTSRVLGVALPVVWVCASLGGLVLWLGVTWNASASQDNPVALTLQSERLLAAYPSPTYSDIAQAKLLTKKQLTMGPLQSEAWARLAYIDTKVGRGVTPAAIADLRMSYKAAPLNPELVMWRQRFAFTAWQSLPIDLQKAAQFELMTFYADYENRARLDTIEHDLPVTTRLVFELTKTRAVQETEAAQGLASS